MGLFSPQTKHDLVCGNFNMMPMVESRGPGVEREINFGSAGALSRISHHLIEWATFRRSAAVREASAAARCERAAAGLRHSRAPIRCLSSLLRPLAFRLNQP